MNEIHQITDTTDYTQEHLRRNQARAPRRRTGNLSRNEMEQIRESLEQSVSGYAGYYGEPESVAELAEASKRAEAAKGAEASKRAEAAKVGEDAALGYVAAFREKEPSRSSVREVPQELSGRRAARARRIALEEASEEYRQDSPGASEATSKRVSETTSKRGSEAVSDKTSEPASEKPRKKHHPFRALLLLLLIFALGFGVYAFVFQQSGYYTVAVFGLDSRSGNVGKEALSDVNILVRVDRGTGEIKLVSLYSDTYSKISSENYHKLNEAYFRGGPEQAVWAVEHNTDVKVDDYAAFNWKAVVDAINILGGVDLEISDSEFKYINAFITETVNSTGVGSYQLEHAGMNHLDGIQAVAYARLRLMDTDYQRTERQRKVIGLALDKAKSADYQTLYTLASAVLPQISTSVTIDDLIPFAKNIRKFEIAETAGFPFDKKGADVGKLDCVIPVTLESNAIKLHAFLYPDKEYAPSAELRAISEKIISDTGLK